MFFLMMKSTGIRKKEAIIDINWFRVSTEVVKEGRTLKKSETYKIPYGCLFLWWQFYDRILK